VSQQKLHVFFRRVSTANQDIITQEAADLPYREKLLPEETVIVNENAVSANKRAIHERPEMEHVFSLIAQGKVDTLYAFDRTRLFREFYEGMSFNDLRIKHGVKLVFTSEGNGHLPSTDDIFLEGILSMFSDIEGKNIARRSEESRRRYPPQKLGYLKNRETKQYSKDAAKKDILSAFFVSLIEVNTLDELSNLVDDYRKKLRTKNERLIEISRDPFYAGYDLHKGEDKLSHVEPYLDLKDYYFIQETKGTLLEEYMKQLEKLDNQNTFLPLCGRCRKPMNYWKEPASHTAFYNCSSRHKKVMVPFQDFVSIVHITLREVIEKLDGNKLLNHSVIRLREIKKQAELKLATIERQSNELMEQILLNTDNLSDWKNSKEYEKASMLKAEQQYFLSHLNDKEQLLEDNKEVIEAVKAYLHDRNEVDPSSLYSMFIKHVFIYDDVIDFEITKFNYLVDLQTDFIYKGDVTA